MLMMPIFAALSMALNNPRLPKTGALLFPTPMLLAALALLLGADARLVTAEIVWPIGGEQSGPS